MSDAGFLYLTKQWYTRCDDSTVGGLLEVVTTLKEIQGHKVCALFHRAYNDGELEGLSFFEDLWPEIRSGSVIIQMDRGEENYLGYSQVLPYKGADKAIPESLSHFPVVICLKRFTVAPASGETSPKDVLSYISVVRAELAQQTPQHNGAPLVVFAESMPEVLLLEKAGFISYELTEGEILQEFGFPMILQAETVT